MTQSPWATNHQDNQPDSALERYQEDNESITSQLDRLSVWGNSQVNKHLFEMLDYSPEIDTYSHLRSSYLFRVMHYIVLDRIKSLIDQREISESFFDRINTTLSDCVSAPSVHDKKNALTSEKLSAILQIHDENRDFPCEVQDAILCTRLYHALMIHASEIVTDQHFNGHLIPRMLSGLADDANEIITSINQHGSLNTAFSPTELHQYDNFIQDGYRQFSRVLDKHLSTLQTQIKNTQINPNALTTDDEAAMAFATALIDIEAYGSIMTSFYDELNDTISAHEWPTVYERHAIRTMNDAADQDDTPLPPITADDGITSFIRDFLEDNKDQEIHPDNVKVLMAVVKTITNELETSQSFKTKLMPS